jgi:hypothetical protein
MYNVDVEVIISAKKLESCPCEKYCFVRTILVDLMGLGITRIKNRGTTEKVTGDYRSGVGNLDLENVDTLGIRPKRHGKALEASYQVGAIESVS